MAVSRELTPTIERTSRCLEILGFCKTHLSDRTEAPVNHKSSISSCTNLKNMDSNN